MDKPERLGRETTEMQIEALPAAEALSGDLDRQGFKDFQRMRRLRKRKQRIEQGCPLNAGPIKMPILNFLYSSVDKKAEGQLAVLQIIGDVRDIGRGERI